MNEKLKAAKALLAAFEAALPAADGIHETVSMWEDGAPPLLRQSYSWHDAMKDNKEKLDQFEGLVHFLSEAIFGVDYDHDSAVSLSFIDRSRYQHRHLPFKVPRLSEKPTLKEIMKARDLAQTNAKSAQNIVNDIEAELKFFLEHMKEGDDA